MRKLFFVSMFLLVSQGLWAQCSMCTKTASTLDEQSARGLNGGIVYLALLPLALIGTIGFIWKRNHRDN